MIKPNVLIPFESNSDHRLAVTHVKISDPSCSCLIQDVCRKRSRCLCFWFSTPFNEGGYNQFPSKCSA